MFSFSKFHSLNSIRKRIFAFALLIILMAAATSSQAAASLQNYTGASCGSPSSSVTVAFEIRAAAWQQAQYAVAFSTDAIPAAGDTWVSGNCSTGTLAPAENGTPVWHPISFSVTVPAGWTSGYLLVLGHENFMTCSPQALLAIPFSSSCFTPTPTVTRTRTPAPTATRTPTPSMPLVKSSNVSSAAVGSTVTYCVAWTNNSNSNVTRTFYDQLAPQLTWVGGDAGCSAAGQLVTCSFATTAGTNGSKCFWAIVNAAPP